MKRILNTFYFYPYILKVGDKMTAYTTKMDETDQWFEEKTVMVNIVFRSLIQIVYQVGYFVVFVILSWRTLT